MNLKINDDFDKKIEILKNKNKTSGKLKLKKIRQAEEKRKESVKNTLIKLIYFLTIIFCVLVTSYVVGLFSPHIREKYLDMAKIEQIISTVIAFFIGGLFNGYIKKYFQPEENK